MVGIDMAIVIPSSKTYNRENQKVRDNVIDKLEVETIGINTKIERNTTVFNKNGKVDDFYKNSRYTFLEDYKNEKSTTENNALYNFYNFNDLYGNKAAFEYNLGWIIIKSTYLKFDVKNTYYSDIMFPILSSTRKIIEVEKPEFTYTLTKKSGSVSNFDIVYGGKSGETINNKVGSYFNNAIIENIETNYVKEEATTDKLEEKLSVTYKSEGYNNVSDAVLSLEVTNKDNTKEAEMLLYPESRYYLNKEIYFLVGVEIITLTKNGYYSSTDQLNAFDITTAPQSETVSKNFSSVCEKYYANNVSIRIFGETISIDFNKKIIIVGNENGKKPHSIDGNELLQTSNYIMGENGTKTNALDKMYGDTQIDYARGKETATIRCSISDYYDGDQKVIAIDNSTGKMSFDIGDRVIPMVFGADGKDRPMSTYQDGSPKEFEVIGTKKFYDGAVWQELSVQEC